MIGMILCGGYGKRLRPLTYEVPKPLIDIKKGYTILDKQIFDFASAGIDEVILLACHLNEKIKERYGQKYKGVNIRYLVEDEPLGTLNAIRRGLETTDDEDVVVSNGDVIADLNLKKMMDEFDMSKYSVSMFVTKMKSPYGIVMLGEEHIKAFKEKPLLDHYINGGIYCFDNACLSFFEDFETGAIENTLFPSLAKMGRLGYYREDGLLWMSIDTSKDLEDIRKEYENRTDKPWGYEKILISTDKYLTKKLFIREGYQTSYHYHGKKDETMLIMDGIGYIEFEDHKEQFERNDVIRIEPGTPHTIVALENTILHEVSTPHLDDSIRIKDFYKMR
ncbi:MAG: sugar phosphate nucleotidyltransferase [Methanosarcinales archaeon Met12]|nr:MAG: sugar phosphate nucleotidyltransferase [Methanosarcinales archaeon Met12]